MFLANSVDEIEVVSPQDVVLDSFVYGTGTGISVPNGFSIERKDATAPPWAANFAAVDDDLRRGRPRDAGRAQQPGPHAALGVARQRGTACSRRERDAHPVRRGHRRRSRTSSRSRTPRRPRSCFPSDGRSIDLAFGWLLDFSLVPNNGVTSGFAGVMSGLGYGFGTIALPPEPALSGITFYAAGVVIDGAYPGGIGSIAPTLALTIL